MPKALVERHAFGSIPTVDQKSSSGRLCGKPAWWQLLHNAEIIHESVWVARWIPSLFRTSFGRAIALAFDPGEIVEMSSTRIASVMIALLGTVPVAFAILVSANGSHADDARSLKEYFIAKNPKDEYAQFQNTNIHLIYACIYARGVDPSGVCEDMSAIAKKDGLVTYVKSPTEHEMGVNFLASDTTYPDNLFQQVYGSCGFRNLPNRSIVIVKNQGLHDNLEGCLYTSSLIHLGFYVDKAISAQIDKKSFDEIIEYYVSSDPAP